MSLGELMGRVWSVWRVWRVWRTWRVSRVPNCSRPDPRWPPRCRPGEQSRGSIPAGRAVAAAVLAAAAIGAGAQVANALAADAQAANVPAANAQADASAPGRYRLPISLAAGGAVQRLLLPAEVLGRSRSGGLADLRVYNREGQLVPIALAGVPPSTARLRIQRVPAYPIEADSLKALDGLQLRIEERAGSRVVTLAGDPASTAATVAAPAQRVVAALLDTRLLQDPVVEIELDVTTPLNRPVTIHLASSADLRSWSHLASTVVMRSEAGQLGATSVTLSHGAWLKDRYLRASWSEAGVTVSSATVTTATSGEAAPRSVMALGEPQRISAHEWRFALPFASMPAQLQITPVGSNVLVPVALSGRNDGSQPWRLLGQTVVYQLDVQSGPQGNPAMPWPGGNWREYKLEADANTAGFALPPQLAVAFEPRQLVFVTSGSAPFTLEVGRNGAKPGFLPLDSLIPGYRPGQENELPLARLEAADLATPGGVAPSAAPSSAPIATRGVVLWAVLLAGVALLAAMVWVLVRQRR